VSESFLSHSGLVAKCYVHSLICSTIMCVNLQLVQISSSYIDRSCKAAAVNHVSFVESGSIQDHAQDC
jgi:hypothetical protein